jgi:hypothetical protein
VYQHYHGYGACEQENGCPLPGIEHGVIFTRTLY